MQVSFIGGNGAGVTSIGALVNEPVGDLDKGSFNGTLVGIVACGVDRTLDVGEGDGGSDIASQCDGGSAEYAHIP